MNEKQLRGLRSLVIRDFKGWRAERTIDTDADIVLLTGANGCGKTSLLEAVNLLVNGHVFDWRSREGPALDELIHGRKSAFRIAAEARGSEISLGVEFQRGERAIRRQDRYWLEVVHGPGNDPPPPELLARATTYFQDRIDSILSDLDRSTTLRDWLVPLPLEVAPLRTRLGQMGQDLLAKAAEEERQLAEPDTPGEDFREGARRFRTVWEALRTAAPELGLPGVPQDLDLRQEDLATALALWVERPARSQTLEELDRILSACLVRIEERLRARRPAAGPEDDLIAERLADILRRLEELDRDWPAAVAERVLSQFSGAPGTAPALRDVLHSVETQLLRWRDCPGDLPGREELGPLREELARLDVGVAATLRAVLERWTAPWEEAQAERERLKEALSGLEVERFPVRPSADARALSESIGEWRRTWDDEARRRRVLADAERIRAEVGARRKLAEVCSLEASGRGALSSLQPLGAEVSRELAKALDGTLVRFHFDSGFLPVRPREEICRGRGGTEIQGYELLTRDDRPSSVLSTGQRGQVALAYMLAQGLLLRSELPHRVLILDDTSTAFDLGNIVRQATWLRQLAYGPPEARWQIFLSSHHEELTVRLIELLVPPADGQLRLMRFLGWTPEEGPRVDEPRFARQNPQLTEEATNKLQRRLAGLWENLPVARTRRSA